MRDIPPQVQSLLKSRSMVGPNRPTHTVTIGTKKIIDFAMGDNWVQPSTDYTSNSLSVAKKTNGNIIICNMVGNEVYEAEASTINTLLTNNNEAVNWQGTGIVAKGLGYATVWNLEGELYLTFSDIGVGGEYPAKQLIYKSSTGNGGDWELYSTIQSWSWSALSTAGFAHDYNLTGIPIKLDDGSWIMNNGYFFDYSGELAQGIYVMKSTDNGVTWDIGHRIFAYMLAGTYYYSFNKRIIRLESGDLYTCWSEDWGNCPVKIIKSTDDGASWLEVFNEKSFTYWKPNLCTDFSLLGNSGDLYLIGKEPGAGQGMIVKFNCLNDLLDNSILTELPSSPTSTSIRDNMTVGFIEETLILTAEQYILGAAPKFKTLQAKSISINQNKNMASSCELIIDNKNGEWAPDGEANHNVLWPNKQVVAEQGYGAELTTTFTGLIDKVEMTTFPQEIRLSTRDNLKKALDQTITNLQGGHVILYESKTVEYIFKDLCIRCGLETGMIQPTGLTITKEFSWESYGDAFAYLADLVGYEFVCDEDGIVHFRRDGKTPPQATNWLMTFTDGVAHTKYYPIIEGSETIKYEDTTYVKDVDYTIDYQTGTITSITIPDVTTTISFTYIAYEFTEGVDIISLGYTIDDNDLYYSVVCYGQSADNKVISTTAAYGSRDYYNVLPQKIMKIDAPDADTVEKCQTVANRAVELMSSRARSVRFAAVAVPWLQVGDFIKITESSTTISEIYRITDLSTDQSESGYIMQMTCYHHGGG